MIRATAFALVLLVSAGPTLAEGWSKDTAPALRRLVNRMENTGDRLAHEYKVSLRRADRWLPLGDEAVLWQSLQTLQKVLNRLENGVGGEHALEIERRMDELFRAWDSAREAASRVRTARSVRRIWDELGADVAQLEVERRILVRRNERFTPPPDDRWNRAVDPARHFGRVELERLRTALLEAEDVSNRLKSALRERAPSRRAEVSIGAASIDRADLREAAFALERHLDALVQSWLQRGAGRLQPDLEVAMSWALRISQRLGVESAPEDALVAWAELVPALDEIARLFHLAPISSH